MAYRRSGVHGHDPRGTGRVCTVVWRPRTRAYACASSTPGHRGPVDALPTDRYASLSSTTPASPLRLRALKPDWIADPKVWRTEVLAGLVVALALIPEAISFSIIMRRGPRDRPLRLVHHGGHDLGRRRPPRDDLRRDGRRRPGDRPGQPRARLRLPGRHRDPGRPLPDPAGGPGRRQAHAVRAALRDDRLRQRPGDPDLHGPGARDARRAVGGLPADRGRPAPDGVLPEGHPGDPGAPGLHRRPHHDHPGGHSRSRAWATRATCPPRSRSPASPTCRSPWTP